MPEGNIVTFFRVACGFAHTLLLSGLDPCEAQARRWHESGRIHIQELLHDNFYFFRPSPDNSYKSMNEMKNFFARHNRPSISRPCVTLCVARDERLHRIVSLCEQFTVNTPEFLSRFRVVAMCIFNEFGGLISSLPSLCQSHVEQVLSRPEFSNYIIPIGSIRIGDAQIRSLALKFVCDKLGIPCCVVRGPTPTDQDDETGSEACRGAFIRTFGCAQKMKRVLGTMETSCRFQLVSRVRRIRKSSYRKSGALILFKSRIALTTLHPTPRAFSCYCMLRRTR